MHVDSKHPANGIMRYNVHDNTYDWIGLDWIGLDWMCIPSTQLLVSNDQSAKMKHSTASALDVLSVLAAFNKDSPSSVGSSETLTNSRNTSKVHCSALSGTHDDECIPDDIDDGASPPPR